MLSCVTSQLTFLGGELVPAASVHYGPRPVIAPLGRLQWLWLAGQNASTMSSHRESVPGSLAIDKYHFELSNHMQPYNMTRVN